MSNVIDIISKKWSQKVGVIDKTNPEHVAVLNRMLLEMDIPFDLIQQSISALVEDNHDKVKFKDPRTGDMRTITMDTARQYASDIKQGDTNPEKAAAVKAAGLDGEGEKEKQEKPQTKIPKNPMGMDKEDEMGNYLDQMGGDDEEDMDDLMKQMGDEPTVTKTVMKVQQNAESIFNDKVSGKGGGTTSLQEEIAGISRKMAIEHPEDTPEQHKERIAQHIKDNYGDTKYGSKDQTKLIKKSASGLSTMKKIKDNESMKFNDNQPEGFPIQVTFTDGGTSSVRNTLEEKLRDASPEDKSHYENELKYFKKHATSETGVEGDGDTGMMYVDTDGRTRMIYISNKQSLGDPHANATVKSATKSIKDSIEPGANEEVLTSQLDEAVQGGIDANGDMVKTNRTDIDSNIEELNKAPLTMIATKTLTGRAEFTDKTSDKYLNNCKKNKQIRDYISENELDIDNSEHVVKAALAVAGSGDADGLNDSTKQAPNKLLLKMTNTTSSVRKKMQRLIDRGKTSEEAAELVANSKQKGKPLMGGNLNGDNCLSIYNNKALEKLEQNSQTRKDAMQQAHASMYNTVVELDVAHHQGQGMSSDESIKKYNEGAGPNERTYTKSFMKRMHWDRYIDGVDDDKKMIEIGDKSYSPKDFKDCLGKLSGWNGEGNLKEYLTKNMRITPGTMKLSFSSKGKTIELGDDTWRTAGDLSKIAGGLGKDMQKCLGSK